MANRRIRRDHQIQIPHHGGGIHEGPGILVQSPLEIIDPQLVGQACQLFAPEAALQAIELNALDLPQGSKVLQRNGPRKPPLIQGTSLPDDAHLKCCLPAEFLFPGLNQLGIGKQVGHFRRNCLQRGPQNPR